MFSSMSHVCLFVCLIGDWVLECEFRLKRVITLASAGVPITVGTVTI